MKRILSIVLVAALGALIAPLVASAALGVTYTLSGNVGFSTDGLGQNTTGGTVEALVPAGSTVQKAFLHGTYFTATPSASDRTIDFDGTTYTLVQISTVSFLSTARADVTTQVATKVGAGGGITSFQINTDPSSLDGVSLTVVYTNPALPVGTVAVLDGGASQAGDTATFTFASPLTATAPAKMAVGSGFSFQGAPGHGCGGGQFSIIDVNSQRLTSCAGNYDDGQGNNGALITVGGYDDIVDNPPFPNSSSGGATNPDDELYDLSPFLAVGNTSLTITSSNPSRDDNFFLAVIQVPARATVTTEICNNGVDDDGDGLIDAADPDCDATKPTCLIRIVTGPPKQIVVTLQDTGSGIASIVVTKSINASTVVPPFTVGTTSVVVVTSTKINQSLSSQVELKVTDVAGNVTVCDPVLTLTTRSLGAPETETFTGLAQAESKIMLKNGSPGVNRLDVVVNGVTFKLTGLKNGEARRLDVASAMKAGSNNTISLKAYGKPGGSIDVIIADVWIE